MLTARMLAIINRLIADEQEAIDEYSIAVDEDPNHRAIYKLIINEEKGHIDMLESILKGERDHE